MLVCQRVICNAGLGNDSAVSCESKPENLSQQLFMSASDAIRSGKLAVCADPCWSPNTYYIYIYICVCVNILVHIHIISHKL